MGILPEHEPLFPLVESEISRESIGANYKLRVCLKSKPYESIPYKYCESINPFVFNLARLYEQI